MTDSQSSYHTLLSTKYPLILHSHDSVSQIIQAYDGLFLHRLSATLRVPLIHYKNHLFLKVLTGLPSAIFLCGPWYISSFLPGDSISSVEGDIPGKARPGTRVVWLGLKDFLPPAVMLTCLKAICYLTPGSRFGVQSHSVEWLRDCENRRKYFWSRHTG